MPTLWSYPSPAHPLYPWSQREKNERKMAARWCLIVIQGEENFHCLVLIEAERRGGCWSEFVTVYVRQWRIWPGEHDILIESKGTVQWEWLAKNWANPRRLLAYSISTSPSYMWEPFKVSQCDLHLVQCLAMRNPIANSGKKYIAVTAHCSKVLVPQFRNERRTSFVMDPNGTRVRLAHFPNCAESSLNLFLLKKRLVAKKF